MFVISSTVLHSRRSVQGLFCLRSCPLTLERFLQALVQLNWVHFSFSKRVWCSSLCLIWFLFLGHTLGYTWDLSYDSVAEIFLLFFCLSQLWSARMLHLPPSSGLTVYLNYFLPLYFISQPSFCKRDKSINTRDTFLVISVENRGKKQFEHTHTCTHTLKGFSLWSDLTTPELPFPHAA